MTYQILSIDGGGIRGILTAVLLERLEQACPGFLAQIDLFAGTSTGGILAAGLAQGLSPAGLVTLYEEMGARVFADTVLDDLRDLGTLIGADYGLDPLQEVLTERFAALTLADLPRRVLISAFDLDSGPAGKSGYRSWKAKFFHNFPGPESDGAELVVDVCLRTAAAPTYFPIYQGYIDGGMAAVNPSMCALAQALNPETGGQSLDQVNLLSLGTGHNPRFLTSPDGDWGLVQWAPQLIHLILDGEAGLADYQCRQVLGARYLRVNPILPESIGMDRYDQIPILKQVAQEVDLETAIAWVDRWYG